MNVKSLPVLALLAALAGTAFANDWPQFRGPDRTDVSKEKGLLREWKETPKLLWTFRDAGAGFSGPAIIGDRLYTMGGDKEKNKETVYALDLKTQKKLWSTEVGAFYVNGNGDGPRGTPTIDGDVLYCLGGYGDLLCVELADGTVRWHKYLKKSLKDGGLAGEGVSPWGYSESPLIDGDKLICVPGGKSGAVAALDKKTGEVLWRSKELTSGAVYSSAMPADIGGVHQYVVTTNGGVAGVAAADGKLLWKSDQSAHGIAVTTPIVAGDDVYVTTGYGVGCGLVKITGGTDGFKAEKVYDDGVKKNMVNHHGGVILLGGNIYGYSDGKGWVCQDLKTGKILSAAKSRDFGKGSLTYADGRFYCYTENNGTVVLADAGPDAWTEKGRFVIPERTTVKVNKGSVWTHPVISNGKLYLRDHDLIFCYDVSGDKSS